MSHPLSWLERVPTYKDQIEKAVRTKRPGHLRLLGYPLMQSADILIYRAMFVAGGRDQVHIEITRRKSPPLQPHLRPRAGL